MGLAPARDVSLKGLNTLGLDARAAFFVDASTDQQLLEGLAFASEGGLPLLVLGGGSNIVLQADWPGLVLHVGLRGVSQLDADGESTLIDVAAGEPWHPWVKLSIGSGWFGLENLSLIPGTVGAAPVQNIGAYGVEVAEFIREVELVERGSGLRRVLAGEQCGFGYRDSVFKGEWRERAVITRVRFALDRRFRARLDYGPVRDSLGEGAVDAQGVSDAIERIRRAKLPDPARLANAGSFFKNPVVPLACYEQLAARYPQMPSYAHESGRKLAAAWLIDQAGWKGYREGPVGVHAGQALVLVNHGGATGAQVLALAARIRQDVAERFGVELEIEPQVY